MATDERGDIILMKTGDERAFERIYQRHYLKILRFARLFTSSPSESEDVLQNVFMRLWNMRQRIDESKPLDPLLFILTRNVVFNSKRNRVSTESIEAAMLMNAEDSLSSIEAQELRNHIEALVSLLPKKQQEAFLLSRSEGLSYKEIADRMGISLKGAERNISLALKSIRKNIS